MSDSTPFDWRKYIRVHPAADEYPLLRDSDPAAFRAVVEDIRTHGMHTSLVFWVDDDGNRLLDDGRNRLDALTKIGVLAVEDEQLVFALTWNGTVWADDGKLHIPVTHCGEDVYGDPYAIAASYNAHRRHLEPEQYHARIEASHARIKAALEREPDKSNYVIGEETGTSEAAVRRVRRSTASGDAVEGKRIGKDGKARKQPAKKSKPKAETPVLTVTGIKRRAKALGVRVKSYGGTHGINVVYRGFAWGGLNLDGANARLDEIEREIGTPKTGTITGNSVDNAKLDEPHPNGSGNSDPDGDGVEKMKLALGAEAEAQVEASGEEMKHAGAEEQAGGGYTDAESDGVTHEIAVGVICEWITSSHLQERNASFVASISISALMQEVRSRGKRVDVKAIRKIAVFLQAVADAFDGPPSDPGSGPAPDGETGENTEAPAEMAPTGTVSAAEETAAPVDRSLDIPDPLIQAARQRHPIASAPQDTPVPLTPPSPAPPPSAPTPPATPRARSKYYAGSEDDPGWRQLGINTLEVRICSAHDYCERFPRAYNKERVREHIEEMRGRLDVLRKADRAERPRTGAEAQVS